MSQEALLFNNKRQPAPPAHINFEKPFLSSAMQYHSLGLCIIPCGGDNGKIACVKWAEYQQQPPSYSRITQWQSQFPSANIGLVTGEVSNLTIVDIDTGKPEVIQSMIARFGDTPIKVKTPSGGIHLYYRHNGENCHTAIDGLPVDIRANGGYVIAPPSLNPKTKRLYAFIEGSWTKIKDLPVIRSGSLIVQSIKEKEPDLLAGDTVNEGQRNNALFRGLLKRAKDCSCLEEFEDIGFYLNETFMNPPLPHDEVEGIINNVWRIKVENKLYGGGERFITVMADEIQSLKDHPRAFWLLMSLKESHETRRTSFAIGLQAIAEKTGWDISTVRHARDTLVQRQYLELIHQGGSKPGDVNIYRFYKGEVKPSQ